MKYSEYKLESRYGMKVHRHKNDLILALFFLSGMLSGYFPNVILFWSLLILLVGLLRVLFGKNPSAYPFAAYLAGLELLVRMSGVPLPHEFTKYAIVLLLGTELILNQKKIPAPMLVYGLLLIPGILITEGSFSEVRKTISASLSGSLCLIVSTVYFYRRVLTIDQLRDLFTHIVFSLAAMMGYMWVQTPDLSNITFTNTSNFQTSIFGPNQVSSILGAGILIVGLSYFMKIRLFGKITSVVLLAALLFRGLLTFARGGMITPVIVLLFVFLYLSWYSLKNVKVFARIVFITIAIAGVAFVIFDYTNKISGNALFSRYAGIKNDGKEVSIDKYTSGRTLIVEIDWNIFLDNPVFGVGVGMSDSMRPSYGYPFEVTAHNEFTRLLAEHGLFGLTAILILVFFPLFRLYKQNVIREKILLLAMIGFCFAFMFHSATRIAMPSFLYGLAFVRIVDMRQIKRWLYKKMQQSKESVKDKLSIALTN